MRCNTYAKMVVLGLVSFTGKATGIMIKRRMNPYEDLRTNFESGTLSPNAKHSHAQTANHGRSRDPSGGPVSHSKHGFPGGRNRSRGSRTRYSRGSSKNGPKLQQQLTEQKTTNITESPYANLSKTQDGDQSYTNPRRAGTPSGSTAANSGTSQSLSGSGLRMSQNYPARRSNSKFDMNMAKLRSQHEKEVKEVKKVRALLSKIQNR